VVCCLAFSSTNVPTDHPGMSRAADWCTAISKVVVLGMEEEEV
jgi:hypothetical protein